MAIINAQTCTNHSRNHSTYILYGAAGATKQQEFVQNQRITQFYGTFKLQSCHLLRHGIEKPSVGISILSLSPKKKSSKLLHPSSPCFLARFSNSFHSNWAVSSILLFVDVFSSISHINLGIFLHVSCRFLPFCRLTGAKRREWIGCWGLLG